MKQESLSTGTGTSMSLELKKPMTPCNFVKLSKHSWLTTRDKGPMMDRSSYTLKQLPLILANYLNVDTTKLPCNIA